MAFFFGYALTSLPLLRAGLAFGAVVPIALASDTLSIAVMEIVDNGIMLVIPGAMEAGLGDMLFWGALSFALVVAGAVALPVNRWLIARGKGHAVMHETGIHGGLPPKVVGIAAAVAFVSAAACWWARCSAPTSPRGTAAATARWSGADPEPGGPPPTGAGARCRRPANRALRSVAACASPPSPTTSSNGWGCG